MYRLKEAGLGFSLVHNVSWLFFSTPSFSSVLFDFRSTSPAVQMAALLLLLFLGDVLAPHYRSRRSFGLLQQCVALNLVCLLCICLSHILLLTTPRTNLLVFSVTWGSTVKEVQGSPIAFPSFTSSSSIQLSQRRLPYFYVCSHSLQLLRRGPSYPEKIQYGLYLRFHNHHRYFNHGVGYRPRGLQDHNNGPFLSPASFTPSPPFFVCPI